LQSIIDAKPSAELRPIEDKTKDSTQLDEEEMGMTYDELNQFGRLRKIKGCGPVSMFCELLQIWKDLKPKEIADKVKNFFFFYSINRHKATTVTPSYFTENYGTDDNRFDHRQFLYNPKWEYQFKKIDQLVYYYENKKYML
jgi:NAD+ synthase (glutamine-hydrolysing)